MEEERERASVAQGDLAQALALADEAEALAVVQAGRSAASEAESHALTGSLRATERREAAAWGKVRRLRILGPVFRRWAIYYSCLARHSDTEVEGTKIVPLRNTQAALALGAEANHAAVTRQELERQWQQGELAASERIASDLRALLTPTKQGNPATFDTSAVLRAPGSDCNEVPPVPLLQNEGVNLGDTCLMRDAVFVS
eukprot:SAG11_NODE_1032_length_6107_cov_3.885819_3_plen_200_part_00